MYFAINHLAQESVEDHQIQSSDRQSDDFYAWHTMTQAFKELQAEGMQLNPELAAAFSPYRTHHINLLAYMNYERNLGSIDDGVRLKL